MRPQTGWQKFLGLLGRLFGRPPVSAPTPAPAPEPVRPVAWRGPGTGVLWDLVRRQGGGALRTVRAPTKSEARARFKAALGCRRRLPPEYAVVRHHNRLLAKAG